jgi:hypothetical protein
MPNSNEFMNHITVNPHDSWKEHFDEISDKVEIDSLQNWLFSGERLLAPNDSIPVFINQIPSHPGYTCAISTNERCLLATIQYQDLLVLTFAVVPDDACAAKMWRNFDQSGDPPPAEAPICMVMLEKGSYAIPTSDQLWLSHFECHVAWAWLKMCDTTRPSYTRCL